VLEGRAPRGADDRRLELCERVLAKSMRLYPPAWVVARRVMEPIELRGHPIAPGAGLIMPQWVVHRDPKPRVTLRLAHGLCVVAQPRSAAAPARRAVP
jgi:hypothetical protein